MTRRQRQLDEVQALCRSGRLARAVDLAFEHVASFGRDGRVVELLAEAIGQASVEDEVRRRFAELVERADRDGGEVEPRPP
jgi:hypothetical protein